MKVSIHFQGGWTLTLEDMSKEHLTALIKKVGSPRPSKALIKITTAERISWIAKQAVIAITTGGSNG